MHSARPPLAVVAQGIGPGLIILIVVAGVSLLSCLLAIPQSLVVRTGVFVLCFLFFAIVNLTLRLMPRSPPPDAAAADETVRARSLGPGAGSAEQPLGVPGGARCSRGMARPLRRTGPEGSLGLVQAAFPGGVPGDVTPGRLPPWVM